MSYYYNFSFKWHKYVMYLCICTLCNLLQVVLCSGGNAAKEELLWDTPTQRHAHPVQQLLFSVQVLLFRQILGIAQSLPTWNNGHLKKTIRYIVKYTVRLRVKIKMPKCFYFKEGVSVLKEPPSYSMTGLMVSHCFLLFRLQHLCLLLKTYTYRDCVLY